MKSLLKKENSEAKLELEQFPYPLKDSTYPGVSIPEFRLGIKKAPVRILWEKQVPVKRQSKKKYII